MVEEETKTRQKADYRVALGSKRMMTKDGLIKQESTKRKKVDQLETAEKPQSIEHLVSKHETSFASLALANQDFFKTITSPEFKNGQLQRMLKANLVGNQLRTFAGQKQ